MSSDETLQRLKREREQADQLYNRALTSLDRALPGRDPQPSLGEETLRLWATTPADPLASLSGWRRRLAGFVWRLVGPMLQQQQQFNHLVAYHLAGPQAAFNSELIHYLQQITLMVDSKDREAAATLQRSLSDGLSALADAIARRWESMLARDQRYEARISAIAQDVTVDQADVHAAIASLQHVSHMLKREVERMLAAPAAATSASGAAASSAPPPDRHVPTAGRQLPDFDAYKYLGFEDQFRGPVEEIRARLGDYLPCFEGASDVLDVGCGRGEFLQLLRERQVTARGVDVNHEMVEACRSSGLDVAESDALAYLECLPDGSLGGLFAAQVVEHLDPGRLIRLLDVAFVKLRPGARIVLETINPACWGAFFDSYIRDLTHVRPIHPETLKYLLHASGFQTVELRYRSPYPESARLRTIPADLLAGESALLDVLEAFNANVENLNAHLFTYRDYAAVAMRG